MIQPEATNGNVIRRMRFVCWITKATYAYLYTTYKILLFYERSGFANVPVTFYVQWLSFHIVLIVVTLSSSLSSFKDPSFRKVHLAMALRARTSTFAVLIIYFCPYIVMSMFM